MYFNPDQLDMKKNPYPSLRYPCLTHSVTECSNVKVASAVLFLTFTALPCTGAGLKLDKGHDQIQVARFIYMRGKECGFSIKAIPYRAAGSHLLGMQSFFLVN